MFSDFACFGRLCERCAALVFAALLEKQLAQGVVRARVFGIEPASLAEGFGGLLKVALLLQRAAEREPCFGVIGLERKG